MDDENSFLGPTPSYVAMYWTWNFVSTNIVITNKMNQPDYTSLLVIYSDWSI
jgi:hypothetical protein